MKNIIIGTAGHIDHGKTTLIKAITGRETDRLKEEQERGISIELGFTYFDLPSGKRAGIIDVPGHEKFIKNMLAGVTGIDIVVLVIAADEGIMPQTKEHLDILNLLKIEKGIIAITKAELVDDDWLELVKEDVKERVKGTFLENSPIIPVSSINKTGIDELISTIDKFTEEIEERDDKDTPRLPVDRVFTISGFGTVVTGTLISGKLTIGDEIQIFPGNNTGRIRSIQVHGKDSDFGYGGQRVAVNLAGLKKTDIKRGDIIAPIDSMEPTMMLDVKLKLIEDSQRIIENRTRVRLYIGSSEILCRVVLLDKEQLTPGETCYAQLRLEESIVAKRGDRFIIRFYSPMITIGGGEILEPNPPKRKRFDENAIKELELKEKGSITDIIEEIIKDKSRDFPSIKDISVITVMPEDKVQEEVEHLEKDSKVMTFRLLKDIHVIHEDHFDKLSNMIKNDLEKFHEKHSLKVGMSKEEIRSKYLKNIKPKLGDSFINKLEEKGIVKIINESISLRDFEVRFTKTQEAIKEKIEDIYLENKFTLVKKEDILSSIKYDKKDILQVYDALIEIGTLTKIKEDIVIHSKMYKEGKEKVINFIKENGSITIAQLRDLLNTNRKLAVSLIENLDEQKITKRMGDNRVLY
ncbi:selenocysteine-specific elongation factor SelB [Gottschalkia purinilytica]|uniref:Selenocysteine-specific elongation factor n=1 Tax=Gottschalkia purinilytica TaxID=1503 RepID=A0A0L0WDB0_GOTPU|nr:selenocysteine-specific translation elongation factor [Gottschalkia purinilytica]KNF09425.1 selenocysteine-specific elongation factor SelB [Gottschalkia purinilytica]